MNSPENNRVQVNIQIGPRWSSRHLLLSSLAALVALLAAACGTGPMSNNGHARQSATDALQEAMPLIAVTYEDREHGSEGAYRAHMELVAAGPKHVRYEIKATGYPTMLFVYDGRRLLVHDPEEYRPWRLYDAPEEHPDMFGIVSDVFADPDSAEFARRCPSATVVGHQRILGRSAVGYHCAAHFLADGSGTFAHVDWLDQKTGVLLQAGQLHATSVDEHPHITAATFSTDPPKGTKVEAPAAQHRPG